MAKLSASSATTEICNGETLREFRYGQLAASSSTKSFAAVPHESAENRANHRSLGRANAAND